MSDFASMSPEQQVPALTELARTAGAHWGVGPTATYQLFKHRENAVFSVSDGGDRFALRVHRPGYHTDAELESELAWIAALRSEGFPTPRVVPTTDGRTMVRSSVPSVPGERQVDLLEWFDGEPVGEAETEALTDPADVAATFRTIGELLATAHNHAETWQRPPSFTRHAWDADGLLGTDPFWGPYLSLEILTDDQRALLDRMKTRAQADLADFGRGPDRYGLIHADLVSDNVLRGPDGLCVIDFDDAGFGWHLFDIATSLFPSLLDDWFDDAQAALVEGYRSRRPLPDDHLARLPLFFVLRATTYLGWAHTRRDSESAEIIGALVAAGIDELITVYLDGDGRRPMPRSKPTERDLIDRRSRHMAGGYLFYDEPVHLIHGEGVWLFDAAGTRYLDCYNNVASVGHGNERVVDAMTEQARLLNVHDRYLHETAIDYAEALAETLPDPLDMVVFVNSGTEANELAVRMARAATARRGMVVMEHSYHGNTTLINELSTLIQARDLRPLHVAAVEPPNVFRGPFGIDHPDPAAAYADLVADAIALLNRRGEGLAGFLCDGIFDSQGCLDAPAGYFATVYETVRAAGGVCIADEVQAGLARTGTMWGFTQDDVVPDIVTFGKPAGNGYPLAGVITSREIVDRFNASNFYFNTFGGNPVQAATGLAVLREIQERNLCGQTADVGGYLTDRLAELAAVHPIIGNIRARGLFLGIDVITDPETRAIDATTARRIPDAMKRAGVLMGLSGPFGNTLKVRPPLVFERQHADVVVDALDQVLTRLDPG